MRIHRSLKMGLAMGVMLVSGGCAADALAQEPATSTHAAAEALTSRVPQTCIVDPKARPAPRPPVRLVPPTRPVRGRPLLIVDGEALPHGSGHEIEPDRIESIEILKGSQAITLYGHRAVDGVILVRTKRP